MGNASLVEVWDRLIKDTSGAVEVMVHAALFLVERPRFVKDPTAKSEVRAKIRFAFGDPEGDSVALRVTRSS